MPFDYQMVTFEEIIKNDFLKWAQLLKNNIYRGELHLAVSPLFLHFTIFPKHPYLVSENLTLRPKSCVVVG